MVTYQVVIDETDVTLLETDLIDVQTWLDGFVKAKVRKITDRLIKEHTNLNPLKLSELEKQIALTGVTLKSAKDKNKDSIP